MIRFFKTLAMPVVASSRGANQAENALNEIKQLWKTGQLSEALRKVDQVERDHPSCSKAAKYYRGEIGYELLEKSGKLPVVPGHK